MSYDIEKYIEFRSKCDGRQRPFIKGTRVEVQYIVKDSEYHNMSAEEIAQGYDHISLAAIYAALAFYHDDRDAMRAMIREDEEIAAKSLKEVGAIPLSQAGSRDDARSVSP